MAQSGKKRPSGRKQKREVVVVAAKPLTAREKKLLMRQMEQEIETAADLIKKFRQEMENCQEQLRQANAHEDQAGHNADIQGKARLIMREQDRIRSLRAALKLLPSKAYGICARKDCGEPIGFSRMQACPATTLCAECKAASEGARS